MAQLSTYLLKLLLYTTSTLTLATRRDNIHVTFAGSCDLCVTLQSFNSETDGFYSSRTQLYNIFMCLYLILGYSASLYDSQIFNGSVCSSLLLILTSTMSIIDPFSFLSRMIQLCLSPLPAFTSTTMGIHNLWKVCAGSQFIFTLTAS